LDERKLVEVSRHLACNRIQLHNIPSESCHLSDLFFEI